MNVVCLTGKMVSDPKQMTNGGGTDRMIVRFSVAVRRDGIDAKDGEPDFIDCVCFGQPAEYVVRYGHKGLSVDVVGKWRVRKWTNREGKPQRSHECMVERVTVGKAEQPQSASAEEREPGFQAPPGDVADDGLPF